MESNNINLNINRDEILRYLGYRNQVIDENTERLMEECIGEIRSIAKVRFVYKFFEIYREDGKLFLKNCVINFDSKDILRHLEKSESCAMMAVTLGSAVDSRIRYYEKVDMVKALILDSCATTAVEEVCDNVCEAIEKKTKAEGMVLTERFSPGYGDLRLDIQKDFIRVLEADKVIGLTASSNSILMPRKSVTAVVGLISPDNKTYKRGCSNCSKYEECEFRRRNGHCGS